METCFMHYHNDIIGINTFFNSPYGRRLITYADYTASGKTLRFIENYLLNIQQIYANTHTLDSFTGETMTKLLHKAEANIKRLVGATTDNYIIPIGSGSTAAIAKLSEILGLYLTPGLKYNLDHHLNIACCDSRYQLDIIKDIFHNMSENRPVVFVSGYEHHSNYLIWKESFAEVVEIKLTSTGEFDYADLEAKLQAKEYQNRIKIGSFSACSNVTGVITDCDRIARIMHKHRGLAFFDFAASAPYVDINMNKDSDCFYDAIFISPHKFIGGPGSAGILVINKHIYSTIYPPTVAGGGTVEFVSPYCYKFIEDVEARENAGTPGILQILKASLAFEFKEHIGTSRIKSKEESMLEKAFRELLSEPNLVIYGPIDVKKRIGIVSFNIKHQDKLLHHKFASRLLNDLFGIQSRAGCACAGPYAHFLLSIDKKTSRALEAAVLDYGVLRPGFVRINFHYMMTEQEVDFIIQAIKFIAKYGYLFLSQYTVDLKTGIWTHNYMLHYNHYVDWFGLKECLNTPETSCQIEINRGNEYQKYLKEADKLVSILEINPEPTYQKLIKPHLERLRWFNFLYSTDT